MLEIRDLTVTIGAHQIVSIDALDLPAGRRLGIVGESGSGKTLTAMSIAGLQPRDAVVGGSIRFDGQEIVGMPPGRLAALRGSQIGVVFQDPLRALNPTMRIGRQVAEAFRLHEDLPRADRRTRVLDLLRQVQLRDPEGLYRRYPHQLSGGQRQRVLIAIAIACRPKLLIADEPTTALDVTVQKGILELLVELSDAHDMGLLFVSHDLGVVRSVTEHVAVVYGGNLVETGPGDVVIDRPSHQYTQALVAANPGQAAVTEIDDLLDTPLQTISGSVPPLGGFPSGCRFRGRCPAEVDACSEVPPVTRGAHGHRFRCWSPAHVTEGTVDGLAG